MYSNARQAFIAHKTYTCATADIRIELERSFASQAKNIDETRNSAAIAADTINCL